MLGQVQHVCFLNFNITGQEIKTMSLPYTPYKRNHSAHFTLSDGWLVLVTKS